MCFDIYLRVNEQKIFHLQIRWSKLYDNRILEKAYTPRIQILSTLEYYYLSK